MFLVVPLVVVCLGCDCCLSLFYNALIGWCDLSFQWCFTLLVPECLGKFCNTCNGEVVNETTERLHTC